MADLKHVFGQSALSHISNRFEAAHVGLLSGSWL